jgi:hypothetical protein
MRIKSRNLLAAGIMPSQSLSVVDRASLPFIGYRRNLPIGRTLKHVAALSQARKFLRRNRDINLNGGIKKQPA